MEPACNKEEKKLNYDIGIALGLPVHELDEVLARDPEVQYKADHSNSAGSKPISCHNCLGCRVLSLRLTYDVNVLSPSTFGSV